MIASAKRRRPPAAAPQGRRKLTTQETRCLSRPCEIANGHAGAPGATPPTIRERLIGQRHCCSRRARTLLTAHRERRSRSEERRVGKEGRSRGGPEKEK